MKKEHMKKTNRLKKAFLSLIILLMMAFIGCGVSDKTSEESEEIVYDESAFEEDVYEIEGEELAALEGESDSGAYADDEMTAMTEEEIEALADVSDDDEEIDLEELEQDETASKIEKDGTYTSKEEVAEYIKTYGELPSNYITKNEAKELGWNSSDGNLAEVALGKSIGGDKFGNYEGMLPEEEGRQYYECDIDYEGGYRNSKRLIYSNDGLIFYTEDHYETFVQLY